MNAHAPRRKLSRKQARLYFKPWLTQEIKRSIKTKNALHKISCKKSHSGIHYDEYARYNIVLTKVKNLSKLIYFRDKFQQSQSDIKQIWKTINQVIRKTISPSSISLFNYPGHNVHLNPNNLSNHFNDYFSSVGSKLATVFPKILQNCRSLLVKNMFLCSLAQYVLMM